eukprot:8834202-Pyramimonas_sp.AAC.3
MDRRAQARDGLHRYVCRPTRKPMKRVTRVVVITSMRDTKRQPTNTIRGEERGRAGAIRHPLEKGRDARKPQNPTNSVAHGVLFTFRSKDLLYYRGCFSCLGRLGPLALRLEA